MKTSIHIIVMRYIEKSTKEKKTYLICTSITDETIYSKNSVKTVETSKQNKKIKKIGSKAVPKEKTITVKFQSKGDLCLKNNLNCFYFDNITQAWANGCIANLTIVLVALIT